MPRPQFTLKTLMWLMALMAAFLGGRALGIREERQTRIDVLVSEQELLRDELKSQLATTRAKVQRNIKVMEDQQRFLDDVRRSMINQNQRQGENKLE